MIKKKWYLRWWVIIIWIYLGIVLSSFIWGLLIGVSEFSLDEDKQGVESNNIEENIKQSIVWVKYDFSGKNSDGSYFESGNTGSGVIVNNENGELTIYTNRHVVDCGYSDEPCFQKISENVEIRTQDGKIHEVDSISFSKSDIDIALLNVKIPKSLNYSVPYYTDIINLEEKVYAVGYPSYADNVVEFSLKEGKITDIKEVLSQSTGSAFKVIESDAYTYFGSSGGGLFDIQGNLIGINTWTSEGESIAILLDSLIEEEFIYCEEDSYFADGDCYQMCGREQVMDGYGVCHDICDDFYCLSETFNVNEPSCQKGYILGEDGFCYLACGNEFTYCPESDSICFMNQCISSCENLGEYVFEDGTCRLFE